MRSANPQSAPEAPADNRAYEPSMEEILASIRRIIADDQAAPANGAASFSPVAESPAGELERDIAAAVTPVVPVPAAPEPVRPKITRPEVAELDTGEPDVAKPDIFKPSAEDARGAESSAVQAAPNVETIDARAPSRSKPAVSEPAVHTAAESAFTDDASLSTYDAPADAAYGEPTDVMEPEPDSFENAAPLLAGSTDAAVASAFNMLAASRLADHSDEIMTLARDMIRPLLRSWIDDNLPGMVERMVRAEIERVARGGR